MPFKEEDDIGIGLDRLRLSGVKVKSIDLEKFIIYGGEYSLGESARYFFEIIDSNTGEIVKLNNLYINISYKSRVPFIENKNYILNLSYKRDHKSGEYICIVEMTAPRLFYETNEENVNQTDKLNLIPIRLKKECLNVGIEIELGSEKVTYFEINYNTHIENFNNTFKFLEQVFIKSNEIIFSARNSDGIKSIMFNNNKKNNTRKIKVYDKTQHLKDLKLNLRHKSTCRIEVSTNHTTTIKNIFQYREKNIENLCNITQTRLSDFFLRTVKTELVEPYFKYKSEVIDYIVLEMDKNKNITELLLNLSMENLLFDVELLRAAIKIDADKKGKDSKYSSNKYRRIIKKLMQVNHDQYNLMVNNCKMIEKLFKEWGF